jgi:hypothetical protein
MKLDTGSSAVYLALKFLLPNSVCGLFLLQMQHADVFSALFLGRISDPVEQKSYPQAKFIPVQ